MRLEALLKLPRAMPAVPEVAARLIETFEAPDVDLGAIAAQIDRDPVLAAKLLQQANSSFFRLARPVATVRDAAMVLGLNKVRALVIATSLRESFHAVGGLNLDQFWHYSFCSALLAKHICDPLKLDGNIAFTTGLLHGMGELVMHAGLPEYMAAINRATPLLDLTRAAVQYEALGYCYAEVGAALAREWRLPKPMTEAIEHHARPLETDKPQPLAAVVHLAAWRARLHASHAKRQDMIYTYPDSVGLLLGVDPDALVTEDIAPLRELSAH